MIIRKIWTSGYPSDWKYILGHVQVHEMYYRLILG